MNRYFFILFMIASASLKGQYNFKKNALYLEFPGSGIWGSVNYERQLLNKAGPGFRIGAGYFSADSKFRLSVPVSINYLFTLRKDKSFIDAGIGTTWASLGGFQRPFEIQDHSKYIWSFVPSLCYRRHVMNKFLFRIGVTPVFNKYTWIPLPALSVGGLF